MMGKIINLLIVITLVFSLFPAVSSAEIIPPEITCDPDVTWVGALAWGDEDTYVMDVPNIRQDTGESTISMAAAEVASGGRLIVTSSMDGFGGQWNYFGYDGTDALAIDEHNNTLMLNNGVNWLTGPSSSDPKKILLLSPGSDPSRMTEILIDWGYDVTTEYYWDVVIEPEYVENYDLIILGCSGLGMTGYMSPENVTITKNTMVNFVKQGKSLWVLGHFSGPLSEINLGPDNYYGTESECFEMCDGNAQNEIINHFGINFNMDTVFDETNCYGLDLTPDPIIHNVVYHNFAEHEMTMGLQEVCFRAGTSLSIGIPMPADMNPPTTEISLSGLSGTNGWYRSPVEVTLTATDNLSGFNATYYNLGVSYMDTTIFSIGNDGLNSIYYYSEDNVGNFEAPNYQTVKIDQTPPVINGAPTTTPNENGWYNTDVTVHFDCSDATSGPTESYSDTIISTEGVDQSASYTGQDLAGNTENLVVSGINIDKTNPVITVGTPANYGLYTVGTTLSFTATDSLSNTVSIVGELTDTSGNLQLVNNGFAPEPEVYTLVVKAIDAAGNIAQSNPVFFVVYDSNGGFATGGGWFYPDSESTLPEDGKATFGFVAKYKQGSSTGNLEFQYNNADINFKSLSIDWLAINEVGAQFQGTGTINGEGMYTFRVMAKDRANPGIGMDSFDITIWENTDTEGEPVHKAKNDLMGGNIIVHKK